jgi:hypothetical protein
MTLLNKIVAWFTRTRFWVWFAEKYIGHFTFRTMGYTKFPIERYFEMVDAIAEPGFYAFVSTDVDSLASRLIRFTVGSGAKYSHGGLVFHGGDRHTSVMHMKAKGLKSDHLLRVCHEADYVTLVKVPVPEEKMGEVRRRIAEFVERRKQITYDYTQEMNDNDWNIYCSEFYYRIFNGIVDDPDIQPTVIAGRKVFDPNQIVRIGKVVFSNHPEVPVS